MIFIILKKELKGLFSSPLAYAIGAVLLAVSGYFFSINLFTSRIADLTAVFMNMAIMFILAVPIITMRLLAGEEQEGTMEFLLTSPITIPQLILGKYLATLCYFIIVLGITFIFPGILLTVSSPDIGVIFTTYLGTILLIGTYIAIGIFSSSFTQNQVISSIFSFGILLILWIFSWISGNLSGPLSSIAKGISVSEHYGDFLRGIIDTSHIVYFLSLIVVFLIFSVLGVSKGKNPKHSYVLIIISLILLISGNIIASNYRSRLDLTQMRRFTLSETTIEVIQQLKEPVKITAFISEGSSIGIDIKNLLREYDFASSKISVSILDMDKNPSIAKKYNVQDYNTIVVESSNFIRKISYYNLYLPGNNSYQMAFNGEKAVTEALLNLENKGKGVIYFLKGHGESSLLTEINRFNLYLQGEGYTVKQLELPISGTIPEDASLIAAVGPQRDLLQREVDMLKTYLDSGGRMFILIGPTDPNVSMDGWKDLIATLGLEIRDDIAVDPERAFYSDPLTLVPMVEKHDVTDILLEKKLSVIFPYTRSLKAIEGLSDTLQVNSLLVTSPLSFGETNLEKSEALPDENDIPGPLHVAFAVSKPAKESASELSLPNQISVPGAEIGEPLAVIVGNMAFVTDKYLGIAGNLDFASSSINWLLEKTKGLNIPPRTEGPAPVNLTGDMAKNIFYTTAVIVPSIILIIGLIIWLRRRYM